MTRAALLGQLSEPFDVLVVGGGSTGLGIAVDAATRGYRTALVEAADFAGATSSRSTKLVHGGIRYLQQGDVGLVREALHERTNLLRNAPHLVAPLRFVCPLYRWFEPPYYLAGFTAYDLLAGGSAFPRSRYTRRSETLAGSPDLRATGLRGSIRYYDGQFDDARLAVALALTALDSGATVLNYARVLRFSYDAGEVCGAIVRDEETGDEYDVRARAVVNATGIFVDAVRRLDDPDAAPLLAHSRGSHLVFARDAYRGSDALLVPRTADGRVLFVIPWLDRVLVGTTDVPVADPAAPPVATRDEADFIVATANPYLAQPLRRTDAVAAFAGLRPLVRGTTANTAKLSREHAIDVAKSGLVTVTGGKWTTYRKMAADALDVAAARAKLAAAPSRTATLPLHGAPSPGPHPQPARRYAAYGTDAKELVTLERADPALAQPLDPRLPYTRAEVVFAARSEAARTVEDVLARRTRALALENAAARASAPAVAHLLAVELGRDPAWAQLQVAAFDALAAQDAAAIV